MEGSVASDNGGHVDRKSHVHNLSYNQSHDGVNVSASLKSEEPAMLKQPEILCDSSYGESSDVVVGDVGTSDHLQHPTEFEVLSSGSTDVSVENKKCEAEVIKSDHELTRPVLLDEKKQKSLTRCATFPCPKEEVESDDSSVASSRSASSCASQKQSPDIGYARSVSLPNSFKLVSALKGSRAQHGASPTATLTVKWAPDVYDPPATSLSHTVKKNHYQRPKAKKASKNKHNRGKTSRGATSGRRNSNNNRSNISNSTESVSTRSTNTGDRLATDGYSKPEVETLDFVSKQDSKCGSSFLREALAKVHISIGEAQ